MGVIVKRLVVLYGCGCVDYCDDLLSLVRFGFGWVF